MKRTHKHPATKGYTLIEMILVMGIMALLLSAGVYYMVGVLGGGQEAKAKADVQAITTSLIRYQTKSQTLPTAEQGLDALVTKPTIQPVPTSWDQMLKAKALTDPWGQPYEYRIPGKENPKSFDVYTKGADGKAETEDDIGNW